MHQSATEAVRRSVGNCPLAVLLPPQHKSAPPEQPRPPGLDGAGAPSSRTRGAAAKPSSSGPSRQNKATSRRSKPAAWHQVLSCGDETNQGTCTWARDLHSVLSCPGSFRRRRVWDIHGRVQQALDELGLNPAAAGAECQACSSAAVAAPDADATGSTREPPYCLQPRTPAQELTAEPGAHGLRPGATAARDRVACRCLAALSHAAPLRKRTAPPLQPARG
jgi:hypothetical protein